MSEILQALYHGNVEEARRLAAGASLTIAEASALGDLERVQSLLTEDPSLRDARSDDGFPALGLAIFFRQPHVARFLIEQGADVNAAAENAQRVAPLHAAAAVRDRETTELLLAHGADPNAKQQLDYTPLHGAASRGDMELAKVLLAHGAEREARGSDGKTPAEIAEKYGHPELAEWLRRA